MKKVIFSLAVFFLILYCPLHSQEISEEAFVVNVEVPVRVYKGVMILKFLRMECPKKLKLFI